MDSIIADTLRFDKQPPLPRHLKLVCPICLPPNTMSSFKTTQQKIAAVQPFDHFVSWEHLYEHVLEKHKSWRPHLENQSPTEWLETHSHRITHEPGHPELYHNPFEDAKKKKQALSPVAGMLPIGENEENEFDLSKVPDHGAAQKKRHRNRNSVHSIGTMGSKRTHNSRASHGSDPFADKHADDGISSHRLSVPASNRLSFARSLSVSQRPASSVHRDSLDQRSGSVSTRAASIHSTDHLTGGSSTPGNKPNKFLRPVMFGASRVVNNPLVKLATNMVRTK